MKKKNNIFKNHIFIKKYEDKKMPIINLASNYKNLYNNKNSGVDIFDISLSACSIQKTTKCRCTNN